MTPIITQLILKLIANFKVLKVNFIKIVAAAQLFRLFI